MGSHPLPPVAPLEEALKDIPADVSQFALKYWDKGVFNLELVAKNIAPNPTTTDVAPGKLSEGTYDGTQTALTEMFNRIERGYVPQALWKVLSSGTGRKLTPGVDTEYILRPWAWSLKSLKISHSRRNIPYIATRIQARTNTRLILTSFLPKIKLHYSKSSTRSVFGCSYFTAKDHS